MNTVGNGGLAYNLGRIDWDLFGTLTFRLVPSIKRAHGRAYAFLRHTAVIVQRPFPELLWCLRSEFGELNGRFHFHFLLGGTITRNAYTLLHQLEYLWGGGLGGGSMAKIRLYDRARAGATYVVKCLTEDLSGANAYEVNKFDLANQVTTSNAVERVWRSMARCDRVHSARTCVKDDRMMSPGLLAAPGLDQSSTGSPARLLDVDRGS